MIQANSLTAWPETPLALGAHSLTTLFQPIVDVRGPRHRIIAVEALSRGPEFTAYESPLALFAAARREGTVAALDRLCIYSALNEACGLPRHIDLFLNVHPETLCSDTGFAAFLADAALNTGIEARRIVIELLEQSRISSSQCLQLKAALQVLRGLGVRLAIDDVSGLPDDIRRALALRPEFLKIAGDLVVAAATDLRARAQLDAFAFKARRVGTEVIAECVETAAVLHVAQAAGINTVQGYLTGRPASVGSLMLAATVSDPRTTNHAPRTAREL